MAWRALLDGPERERGLALVEAIADELDRRAPADPSFGGGQAGIAVLHGYRARAGRQDGGDRAFGALEQALDRLELVPRPWLFRGSAGVAFALHHLRGEIGDAADEALAELTQLAHEALAAPTPWWDLTDGAIGLGVLGLELGELALVESATRAVIANAQVREDGVAWRAHLRQPEHPAGHTNLGLAHGAAGAIAFLAEAHAAGALDPLVTATARAAIRHLRGLERADRTPRYPMFYGEITREHDVTLDGWCYGDASTAVAFAQAGAFLGEPELRAAAHALARHAARRTEAELAAIAIDSTLCHGAISHAHLLHRLGHHFADDELLSAARRWYTRALAGDALAALPESGLQIGLAGLALGLLAGATDVEPAWDRAFLLALPR